MEKPALPPQETTRLAALCGLGVLDTPSEERFDRITRVAQQYYQVPISLVSLIDAERQWFKSRQGLAAAETPRDISFCGHAILSEDIFYIPNALEDPRFADNPLVTHAPHIRFYAGAPLHASGGERIGTLCIIDTKVRQFTADELHVLRDLADCVEVELDRTRIIEAADEAHRFKQILDKARDMIFMFDTETLQFTYLNQGAVQNMGYAHEQLLRLHPYDVEPHFPEPAFRQLIVPLLSGERDVLQFETVHRRNNGSEFPVEVFLQLVRDADGADRFIAIVHDISARQQADAELRAVTTLRKAILDSANFSIIATDSAGIINVFSEGAQRLLGYTADEMVGKHTPVIVHMADEIAARAAVLSAELNKPVAPGFEVFVAKTRDGKADENEWTYVRRDGSTFRARVSVTTMFDDAGRIYGYLGIGSDLTERERADKMKREFISTVSHELRTPLTSIRGALGLVAGGVMGPIPEQALELVNIASNNCQRLVRLINDILDMDKIESGKMRFDMGPVVLHMLVEETIVANQAYAAQHEVSIEVDEHLPSIEVSGDRDRLTQVLTNLLSNAIKFTRPATTVRVSLIEVPEAVELRVQDQGPGIAAEFQPRLFQKFSQADSSDTRRKGGSGLGLCITQAIVEHHGGKIGFETAVDQGSTFWVRLPTLTTAIDNSSAGPARLLVVEDDKVMAKLLRLVLEQAGYTVDIAYNLTQAREHLRAIHYATVTLDLLLDGENGMTLVRELRARSETVALPVVVVSTAIERGREELDEAALSVFDWLEKPIDEKRLLNAIADAMHTGKKRRRARTVSFPLARE